MNCEKCGSPLREYMVFCPQCGNPLHGSMKNQYTQNGYSIQNNLQSSGYHANDENFIVNGGQNLANAASWEAKRRKKNMFLLIGIISVASIYLLIMSCIIIGTWLRAPETSITPQEVRTQEKEEVHYLYDLYFYSLCPEMEPVKERTYKYGFYEGKLIQIMEFSYDPDKKIVTEHVYNTEKEKPEFEYLYYVDEEGKISNAEQFFWTRSGEKRDYATINYRYSEDGKLEMIDVRYKVGTDPGGMTCSYDENGNISCIIKKLIESYEFEYTKQGILKRESFSHGYKASTVHEGYCDYAYYPDGTIQTVTQYDDNGELKGIYQFSQSGRMEMFDSYYADKVQHTILHYDEDGKMTAVETEPAKER